MNPYKDPDEEALERSLEGYTLRAIGWAYEEAKRILDKQFEQVESLNTKASILLGFIGVILATLFGLWRDWLVVVEQSAVIYGGVIATAVILFAAAVCGFLAYRVQTYETAPSPQRLMEKYLTWEPDHVRYVTLHRIVRIYEHNDRLIKRKLFWLKATFYLLVVGLFVLTGIFLYNMLR